MTETQFVFPYGYQDFSSNNAYNFQLNRFYSMGVAGFNDMKQAGMAIFSHADWGREMLKLAEKAVAGENPIHASCYYRSAEFYLLPDDPDKQRFYDKFREYFEKAFGNDRIERIEVLYGSGALPVMKVSSYRSKKKGTIVMHGGNDSFIEEFYPMIDYLAGEGYEVIAFDGPGQGLALKKYGLVMNIEWEKPVKAVLDHFDLDDVTLIGISMGGWLCLRAAAFEPRVKRVIAWSVSYDVTRYTNALGRLFAGMAMKRMRSFVNGQMKKNMTKSPEYSWFVNNLMYITGKQVPIEAFDVLMGFTAENLHSEMVRQDVLILTGKEDHLVPYKMHPMQVKALTNARSVTGRVFTREEQAQNHCQMGNIGLALSEISRWLEKTSRK